jgi:glycosyltransferase involved in cell wall biosynthesis
MTLKAATILKEQNLDFKILMIGSKDEFYYNEVINYISDNSLNDIVEISEKISKEEWIYKSQNYDIMVSNPDIDNTPVSLIEGMALGMCVISTSVGGVPFLFSDLECSFVPKNDHEALASRINSLLINSDYANKLSKSGRRKAEEFDWNNVKEYWIHVFNT